MATKDDVELDRDWPEIIKCLPAGWEQQARTLGALKFGRRFAGPQELLRVLLIYFLAGCSMRETVVRAREAGLADVSDVALLKRINHCGDWLRWMSEQLMAASAQSCAQPVLAGHRLLAIDGSVVREAGGHHSWRLHYALELDSLRCREVHITSTRHGESMTHFALQPGDVVLADRGYANRRGICHALKHGADVLVRLNLTCVPLYDEQGQPLAQLPLLRTLKPGHTGEWCAFIKGPRRPVRLCAYRMTEAQRLKSASKYDKYVNKKQYEPSDDTIEARGYVVVLTTLEELNARQILALYRQRWQVELAFKRLKSLLGIGHLKKHDADGARAWLQGKLFVACLIDNLIALGDHFPPEPWEIEPAQAWQVKATDEWCQIDATDKSGPTCTTEPTALPLAGNVVHAQAAHTGTDTGTRLN
jgi:hypothetical protein